MTHAAPEERATILVAKPLADRLLAACNGDADLMREKLEFCIAAYCDADAAIREAYRQEGVDHVAR